MRRANRQFAQYTVFSVAYSDTPRSVAVREDVYSLHVAESPLVVGRTKSMAARLRDVGKLKFMPEPERFRGI
jgi:hypothetical protein